MSDLQLEGVYVPVVTPFDADEGLDLSTLTKVIDFTLDGGVRGVVSCGTTGEYYAMSSDERVRADGAHRGSCRRPCPTGRRLQRRVRRAKPSGWPSGHHELGYDAIMLAAPPTSLPSQRELAAHYRAVADAVDKPVVLYNYPARAGVEIGYECLDAVADHPNIVAIKESSGDFSRFLHLQRTYAGNLEIMCGSDDQAADYFAWGVRSWLAGTANVLPRHHVIDHEHGQRGQPRAGAGRSSPASCRGSRTWRAGRTTQGQARSRAPGIRLRPRARSRCCVSPTTSPRSSSACSTRRSLPRSPRAERRVRSTRSLHRGRGTRRGRAGHLLPGIASSTCPGVRCATSCGTSTRSTTRSASSCASSRAAARRPAPTSSSPRRPAGRRRVHHLSGRSCPRHERLEHHLRCHGIARDRHDPDGRARDACGARDRRRPHPSHGDVSRRPLRARHASTACRRFVEALDVPLHVPGLGDIKVDVAYGGCYYVFADPAQFGVKLDRAAAPARSSRPARRSSLAARQSIKVRHPEMPEIDFISYVMLIGDDDPANGSLRGATVLSGRVDRSPCGTGNSARLACWQPAGGRSRQPVHRQVADRQRVRRRDDRRDDGRRPRPPCCRASPAGVGWSAREPARSIRSDPYPLGYVLSDVWGDEVGSAQQ